MTYRVAYREDRAVGFRVNLIRKWVRGEIEQQDMSASSGPKDQIRNRIWDVFDRNPAISYVLMVRGEFSRSQLFLLLVNSAGYAVDMQKKAVVIQEA